MKNEFANRQNMYLTILGLLDKGEFQPVWKDQKPVAFTTRAAELRAKIAALTGLVSEQQAATTGYAADKAREERELEELAHEISQALAGWLEDQGRQADAAKIDLTLSAWQGLRDAELVAKAKLLHQHITAALAQNDADLANYGLDASDATALAKETADYEAIIADPSVAISRRKSLTRALRPQFREVAELLAKMDRLVLRFRRDEPGTRFAAAWQAARMIRDLGASAPAAPAPATPAPATP
jgi:hypothetical protein